MFLTTQEVFDKVSRHLLKQNRKATDKVGGGLYLTVDGCKCAIGSLIHSDHYDPYFEGSAWDDTNVKQALRKSDVNVENELTRRLLDDLQDAHDTYDVERWPIRLVEIAAKHELKYTAPTT